MSVVTRPEGAPAEPADPRAPRGEVPAAAGRYADVLVALAPGASIVFLGFNAGGFFPGTVGFLTVIVLQLLALRLLAVERPFARAGTGVAAVVALLCAFALWTLASTLWSHATARSLEAFDRDVLYIGLFAVFGLGAQRKHDSLGWMIRGLTAGIVIVCGAGLCTRLFPDVWPIAANVSENRLSFPVTYWNALGVLAAFGIVFALSLSRSGRERAMVRVLAAGIVPILAVTLYFTFSRGAVVAALIGLAAFVILASVLRT